MPMTVNGPSDWSKTFVEWTEGRTAFISVVFSWHLQAAYQRAVWLRAEGYSVRVGGPAVMSNPGHFPCAATEEWALSPHDRPDALARHNPNATFTSRGCVRRCSFCAVPRIEGDLVELRDWEPRPVVCDNNLLACSRAHFDRVVDRLKPVSGVDFNQGLDARLLTPYHAGRLAELDLSAVRLAWDSVKSEAAFMRAYGHLRRAGIPKRLIRVYVLIGYKDDPDDALYRLESVRRLGITPNPMRYQPLDSAVKDAYVAGGWTDRELRRYVRYWSNLAHLGGIPFDEFKY